MDFRLFFRRKLTACSTFGAQSEPGLASFRLALEHIRRGDIDVRPLLSHVVPIEEIDRAFRLADTREDGALKVTVSF
jgi:L-iditol 2-dehydrogenase